MSIVSVCTECKAKSQDGIMEHSKQCSANIFLPKVHIDYSRPPAVQLTFSSEEEMKNWLGELSTSGTGSVNQDRGEKAA